MHANSSLLQNLQIVVKMTRKRQGYVKKRKGFNGVPYQEVKRRKKEEEEKKEEPTASEKKLKANQAAMPPESSCSPTYDNPRSELQGFYLVSGTQLTAALQAAHVCPGGKIQV